MVPGGVQEMLCVSEQGLYFFLGRSDKPAALPFNATSEEIAEAEDITQQMVSGKIEDFTNFGRLAKNGKTKAEFLDDFDPPVYNVWKQQTKTEGTRQARRTDIRHVAGLLYTGGNRGS
jgi:hypothetical protein